MEQLTTKQQQMQDFFEVNRSELLKKFSEPQYNKYKIKYTRFSFKADLRISPNHNITDYLAIGLACLAKDLKTGANKKGKRIIYVKHKKYPTPSQVRQYEALAPSPYGGRPLPPNALLELIDECYKILDEYFHDKSYINCLAGMLVYSTVTCAVMEYTDPSSMDLEFENFNDTVSAQKRAFETLRDLIISNILGGLHEIFYGDD